MVYSLTLYLFSLSPVSQSILMNDWVRFESEMHPVHLSGSRCGAQDFIIATTMGRQQGFALDNMVLSLVFLAWMNVRSQPAQVVDFRWRVSAQ